MSDSTKNIQLESWVINYSDKLYSWAYHKVSSKENAEDLVQETFLAATKSYENCKNKENPKTWLFSILNHKIIDHYRKHKSTAKEIINQEQCANITNDLFDENGKWNKNTLISNTEYPENLLDNAKFNTTWNNCIQNLPEKWRFIIQAKFISNKKGNEICKELNISSTNYWQIIHRAKLMLKACLNKNWNHE